MQEAMKRRARYRHLKEKMDSREEAEHGKGGAAAYERFCRKIDGLTENQARAYCQKSCSYGQYACTILAGRILF